VALEFRELRLLTLAGIQDAARRRIVPALIVVCLVSLMMVNSCTQCSSGATIQTQGGFGQIDLALWAGVGVFLVLTFWIIVLAGLLASDHLTATLEDGSALLVLARPVSRSSLALSRLFGSLTISLGAGAVLQLGASFFLAARSDLNPIPALFALMATSLSALSVAAFAMTISLFFPRIIAFLLILGSVTLISMLNLVSFSGAELEGVYYVLDRMGPPFVSSVMLALVPWSGQPIPLGLALETIARLFLWAFAGVSSLVFFFRRLELTRLEPL
jgi:ABC-type transport system involved in multi-copper enzyme maturation permease subunit